MAVSHEIQENIKEVLLNDSYSDSEKLKAIHNLKKEFRPPDKIFNRLSLLPVLQSARISLESKKRDKNFYFNYGISLVQNVGRDSTIDSEIFYQLEFVLAKLKENDDAMTNLLVTKLWSRLENGSVLQNDGILNVSKQVIERTVLHWLDNSGDPQIECLCKMTVDSPKLFQMLTAVFYEILVRTGCHSKVLEMQKVFVHTVKNICKTEGKNFLGLYPKGCARLVALLMVSPQVFPEGEDIFNNVVSLLLEMFLADRRKALILLSHYPEWITILKFNLEQSKV